ncbi:Ribose 5-phosphate isomerase B [Bacillus badius]|uniref:Ribose 5-phosphate isomerase B n=1 Tax=Bacillus badius TaxID=1455 RepID=A0ABR5AV13_BACBA|nr:Ribose 5-phosphate isomerase B [Bacillus badius]
MIPFSTSYSYTAILFLGTLLIAMEGAQTPAGSAGQARPRRRLDAEEARRPPRGKRSSLEWKLTGPFRIQNKKAIDKL